MGDQSIRELQRLVQADPTNVGAVARLARAYERERLDQEGARLVTYTIPPGVSQGYSLGFDVLRVGPGGAGFSDFPNVQAGSRVVTVTAWRRDERTVAIEIEE